eukprot:407019-Rhodomonas_salina.1
MVGVEAAALPDYDYIGCVLFFCDVIGDAVGCCESSSGSRAGHERAGSETRWRVACGCRRASA